MSKRKTPKPSFGTQYPLSFDLGTAGMLGLAPQKDANLRSYNLKNFSIEELVGLLASLTRNQDNGVLRR
jgi:hypothetical protein